MVLFLFFSFFTGKEVPIAIFKTGASTVYKDAEFSIDSVALSLLLFNNLNVVLRGYADTVGNNLRNYELSKKRLETVSSSMINRYKLEKQRLILIPMGEKYNKNGIPQRIVTAQIEEYQELIFHLIYLKGLCLLNRKKIVNGERTYKFLYDTLKTEDSSLCVFQSGNVFKFLVGPLTTVVLEHIFLSNNKPIGVIKLKKGEMKLFSKDSKKDVILKGGFGIAGIRGSIVTFSSDTTTRFSLKEGELTYKDISLDAGQGLVISNDSFNVYALPASPEIRVADTFYIEQGMLSRQPVELNSPKALYYNFEFSLDSLFVSPLIILKKKDNTIYPGFKEGIYYFRASVFDSIGLESKYTVVKKIIVKRRKK